MNETDLQKAVRYLQQYLDSSSWDGWTVEDLMKHYTVYPIIVDGVFEGLFGCTLCDLENQKICSIMFLYIEPRYRNGHIKKVFMNITETLGKLGVTKVYISTDKQFSKVFEAYLHKEHEVEGYIFSFEELYNNIRTWERTNAQ